MRLADQLISGTLRFTATYPGDQPTDVQDDQRPVTARVVNGSIRRRLPARIETDADADIVRDSMMAVVNRDTAGMGGSERDMLLAATDKIVDRFRADPALWDTARHQIESGDVSLTSAAPLLGDGLPGPDTTRSGDLRDLVAADWDAVRPLPDTEHRTTPDEVRALLNRARRRGGLNPIADEIRDTLEFDEREADPIEQARRRARLAELGLTEDMTEGEAAAAVAANPKAQRLLRSHWQAALEEERQAERARTDVAHRYQGSVAQLLNKCPVIVADNVRRWYDLKPAESQFPCVDTEVVLYPKWPAMFVEFNESARFKMGALAISTPLDDSDPQAGWMWDVNVFVGENGTVAGPVVQAHIEVDGYGRVTRNDDIRILQHPDNAGFDVCKITLGVWASMLTLGNCKNVRSVYRHPAPGQQKQHRKKHKSDKPLVGYHVLQLDLGGGQRTLVRSRGNGDGMEQAFKIVAGGPAHYGDCCPFSEDGTRGHAPHGRLFGKFTGVFFKPAHARGNPQHGVVVTDYEVGDTPS